MYKNDMIWSIHEFIIITFTFALVFNRNTMITIFLFQSELTTGSLESLKHYAQWVKTRALWAFTRVKLFKRMLQMSSAVVPLVVVLAPFDSARPLYYISWTPALHWPPPFLLHLLHSTNHFMLIPGTTTSLTSSWTTSDILPLYLHSTSRGYHV